MPSCQSCKATFSVAPEDVSFYTRVAVPQPTFCPECRIIRRLAFRNERSLYPSACSFCKKTIIAVYAPDAGYTVACFDCWWSDAWDPLSYGVAYDWTKPFFVQFQELMRRVPRPNFFQRNSENSPYANIIGESKNVYLGYSIVSSEDVYYSKAIERSYHIFDSLQSIESEWCYWNVFGTKNYGSCYLSFSRNCVDSWFLYDCVNCKNCFLSYNLRNKEYVIRNRQYAKEDYFKELAGFGLGSAQGIEKLKEEFERMVATTAIHRYANNLKVEDSTGDNLANTQNAKYCFDVYNAENVSYSVRAFGLKDCLDVGYMPRSELIYEYTNGGDHNYLVRFSTNSIANLTNADYTDYCHSSSYLFGCIGVKNKKYCILDKQYSEAEFESLVPKIRKHMDEMPYTDAGGRTYRYGEFFPMELSPFGYNETLAQEHFPLTPEDSKKQGYLWREHGARGYMISVQGSDLPDHIKDVQDTVLEQTIGCGHGGTCLDQCTTAYKIVKPELEYYRKMNLPLPQLCPNCRHADRMSWRNPLRLWHRQCTCELAPHPAHAQGRCPNEFETTYAPERPEKVYCEPCYQAEVL